MTAAPEATRTVEHVAVRLRRPRAADVAEHRLHLPPQFSFATQGVVFL